MAKELFQKGFECGYRKKKKLYNHFLQEVQFMFHLIEERESERESYIGELSAVIDIMFKGYQGGKIRREKQILLVVQIYLGKKNPQIRSQDLKKGICAWKIFFSQHSN